MLTQPFLIALCSAVLFGAAAPACKPLLGAFSPFQLAGLLYLGAALGVLPFTISRRDSFSPQRLDRRNRLLLIGAVGCGGILGPVLLLFGLDSASATSVSLWLNMELVATAIMGTLLFRDRLGKVGWMAAAGILSASIWLAWGEGLAGIRGGVLVSLACLCWGFDNHFTALIDGITPTGSTFWKGVVAGTTNLVLGSLLGPWDASLAQVGIGLVIGAFSYGASIVLYISAAQRLGATRSQLVFSSAPFFGVLFAFIGLGERISSTQLAAGAILVVALAILSWERHQHRHAHEPQDHEHAHRHDDAHHDHGHPGQAVENHHTHRHRHIESEHAHPHWPDLHHRHGHD
ncbi:MAG: DMT family transporter [Elusimicrobiota bacterium]|jgi:drug/metabolite transporter (DMT)-like permease